MNIYERTIDISHMEENTKLLGPYNRFVIWVHGCCFNCRGCLAESYKNGSYSEMKISEIAEMIENSDAEGITISGGEPFLQAEKLADMIRLVRKKRDIGVIIYSGFTIEELLKNDDAKKLLEETDILIDGQYKQELDDGKAYVGSSNQRILYLTERYKKIGKEYYSAEKRKVEIKLFSDKLVMIGVPSSEQLEILNNIMKTGGIKIDDRYGNNDS